MRVLCVNAEHELRGGEWQVVYLMGGLLEAGHHATLLARAGSPLYQVAASRGVEVKPLRLRS